MNSKSHFVQAVSKVLKEYEPYSSNFKSLSSKEKKEPTLKSLGSWQKRTPEEEYSDIKALVMAASYDDLHYLFSEFAQKFDRARIIPLIVKDRPEMRPSACFVLQEKTGDYEGIKRRLLKKKVILFEALRGPLLCP